ncbi:DUF3221 domain-containing protein [Paenibacillus sp. GCM10027627]|uniref:DUF3221 domain-containing protein n=1 Tax=unclassified Paenibacillus TaxID=185978 RepID=UPI00362EA25A
MKKTLLVAAAAIMMLAGCSSGQKEKLPEEPWNYETGRVIAIEESRVLVVESADITDIEITADKSAVDELLKVTKPDAIWLTVTDMAETSDIVVGDEVRVELEGEVKNSYPAEGNASQIMKVTVPA